MQETPDLTKRILNENLPLLRSRGGKAARCLKVVPWEGEDEQVP